MISGAIVGTLLWLWLFWEAKNAPQDPEELTPINENKI